MAGQSVSLGAVTAGQPVLTALQYLRKVEDGGKRGKTWPMDFVPKSWQRRVLKNGVVDLRAWTLCLVNRLRGAIRQRDVFAAPSLRYSDRCAARRVCPKMTAEQTCFCAVFQPQALT